MATSFRDLGVSFGINIALVFMFLFLYSVFSSQPLNARVYFTKWFVLDDKAAAERYEGAAVDGSGKRRSKKIEWSLRSYIHSFDWIGEALRMPEKELITHAGLDCVVYLRIFKLGLKIFVPIAVLGFAVLVPINYTSDNIAHIQSTDPSAKYSQVDKMSIANVRDGSALMWVHATFAWLFSLWTWYCLRSEYKAVAELRSDCIADQNKAPDQFTVLVRQVPPDHIETIPQHVDHFFSVNHPDHYLLTQAVYNANKLSSLDARKEWLLNKLIELDIKMERYPDNGRPTHKVGGISGCCGGELVDSIDFYKEELEKVRKEIDVEREHIVTSPSSVMAAAFVSFRSRYGAAIAAQTEQCRDSSKWITEWAPEPRDVVWSNLPLPYVQLAGRRILIGFAVFMIVVFYAIPVSFVQSLANLSSLEAQFPWLRPIIEVPFINSFLQGFLPGLALKIFLSILPYLLLFLSNIEGWVSNSTIERTSAGKYFYFMVVTVFLSNVLIGSIYSQLKAITSNPTSLPKLLGNAIPTKATFFITYTMLDAWAGVSSEIVLLTNLVLFHIQNALLVRTPADRVKAMAPQGPLYVSIIPQVELYFLLPLVYCVIAPLYLPFVLVYYMFAFIVYRNQFINVYAPTYESMAVYWPHFHSRVFVAHIIQLITLIGVFTLKKSAALLFVLPIPVVAIIVHFVLIDGPFRSAFFNYSLQEAMRKDTIESASDPDMAPQAFLERAYVHPSLNSAYDQLLHPSEGDGTMDAEKGNTPSVGGAKAERPLAKSKSGVGSQLVPVKRYPRSAQPTPSGRSSDGIRTPTSPSSLSGPLDSNGTSAAGSVISSDVKARPPSPMFSGSEPLLVKGQQGGIPEETEVTQFGRRK